MKKSLIPILLLLVALASCGKKTDTTISDSANVADSAKMAAPAAPTAMAAPSDTINRHPATPPKGGKIGPPPKQHHRASETKGSASIMPPASAGSPILLNTINGMQPDTVIVSAAFSGPDGGELSVSSPAWGSSGYGCPQCQGNTCTVSFPMPASGNSVSVNAFLLQSGWASVTNNPPGTQLNNSGTDVTTYIMGADTCVVTVTDTGHPVAH